MRTVEKMMINKELLNQGKIIIVITGAVSYMQLYIPYFLRKQTGTHSLSRIMRKS